MSNFVEKKAVFKGMTLSQMKAAYSKMTPAERGKYAGAFVRAAKTAPKSKPISKSKPVPKADPKAKDYRSRTPEAVAARAKRARIMKQYPATGAIKIAADSKKAKAALDAKYGGKQPDKPKTKSIPVKNRRGRTTGSKEVPVTPKKKTPKVSYNRRGRRL